MLVMNAVPCQHIADYYHHRWHNHRCIAFNLLRWGYAQWAAGIAHLHQPHNNLYKF